MALDDSLNIENVVEVSENAQTSLSDSNIFKIKYCEYGENGKCSEFAPAKHCYLENCSGCYRFKNFDTGIW
ncbi:MAG: hypothetical protein WCX73_00970 [Candidatus Pacearchaeota archaeon]|jgi:hypothetical protein